MPDLVTELEQTEAKAAHIRRQIRDGDCAQYGHTWTDVGGCNAGCGSFCACSVPVHKCSRCGDMDYGNNPEAKDIVAESVASTPTQENG